MERIQSDSKVKSKFLDTDYFLSALTPCRPNEKDISTHLQLCGSPLKRRGSACSLHWSVPCESVAFRFLKGVVGSMTCWGADSSSWVFVCCLSQEQTDYLDIMDHMCNSVKACSTMLTHKYMQSHNWQVNLQSCWSLMRHVCLWLVVSKFTCVHGHTSNRI